jgi:NAD(P)H-dependent FMN reductase
MAKILVLAGSARRESFNKKLATLAATVLDEEGASVTLVDLAHYPMPIYDGDLEAESGVPEKARELRELMQENHALVLASPEYNGSVTPLLKNTLDWVSRPEEGAPGSTAFKGKVAALLSASPGGLGGQRGLVHLRAILNNLGVLVLPSSLSVTSAHKAFRDEGALADERLGLRLKGLMASLVRTAKALENGP